MIASELIIKNILSELLFDRRISESIEDRQVVNYLYQQLYEAKLLYGEPLTIPELRSLLRQKILNFQFIKLDGEIRDARGTTLMKYVPQSQHPKGIRPSSQKVATFYDLDKEDWRSVSQRSKEIVLKKDEETGKPIVMVKDKSEDGDVAVEEPITTDIEMIETPDQIEQPDVTIDGEPIDQYQDQEEISEPEEVEVKNVKPIKKTERTSTYYIRNNKNHTTEILDISPKDLIKKLKTLGPEWDVITVDEYNRSDEKIKKDFEQPIVPKKLSSETKNEPKTNVKLRNIISKDQDLENVEASDL